MKQAVVMIVIYCSVWQGVRTCSGTDGYLSRESQWQGRTYGDDNQGNSWRSFNYNGTDIFEGKLPPVPSLAQ